MKNKNKNAICTIVCLPLQFAEDYSITSKIAKPRGKCREKLHEKQLIAKINIKNSWNENQITKEICELFEGSFTSDVGNHSDFGFVFLSTLSGSKMLIKPKVNDSFVWDAPSVLSLNRTTICILSNLNHKASCFSSL